jgi:uncharacterized protein (DUF3820 family)
MPMSLARSSYVFMLTFTLLFCENVWFAHVGLSTSTSKVWELPWMKMLTGNFLDLVYEVPQSGMTGPDRPWTPPVHTVVFLGRLVFFDDRHSGQSHQRLIWTISDKYYQLFARTEFKTGLLGRLLRKWRFSSLAVWKNKTNKILRNLKICCQEDVISSMKNKFL